jgi:VanZ family protein
VITALVHDPRLRPAWRGLLVVLLVVVSWLAFGPAPPQPDFEGGDKIEHLLAFLALAVTAAHCGTPGWRNTGATALGLLLYGGFIELVQTRLPHRTGDWADLAADAVGMVAGLLLAAALRRTTPGLGGGMQH